MAECVKLREELRLIEIIDRVPLDVRLDVIGNNPMIRFRIDITSWMRDELREAR